MSLFSLLFLYSFDTDKGIFELSSKEPATGFGSGVGKSMNKLSIYTIYIVSLIFFWFQYLLSN